VPRNAFSLVEPRAESVELDRIRPVRADRRRRFQLGQGGRDKAYARHLHTIAALAAKQET